VLTHIVSLVEVELPIPSSASRIDLFDNLLTGPCCRLLEDHVGARLKYHRDLSTDADAYVALSAALEQGSEVFVWTSDTWKSKLMLALICANAKEGLPITMVNFPAKRVAESRWCGVPIVQGEGPRRRALTVPDCNRAAAVWAQYCSADPNAIIQISEAGYLPLSDDFGQLAKSVFPRRSQAGMLLSRLDAELLSAASKGVFPYEFLISDAPTQRIARAWSESGGDAFVAQRLVEWSEKDGGRFLKCTPNQASTYRSRFELTREGRGLVDALPAVELAPTLEFGGTIAYDPAAPFFCTD
jgi:hypothetical protein